MPSLLPLSTPPTCCAVQYAAWTRRRALAARRAQSTNAAVIAASCALLAVAAAPAFTRPPPAVSSLISRQYATRTARSPVAVSARHRSSSAHLLPPPAASLVASTAAVPPVPSFACGPFGFRHFAAPTGVAQIAGGSLWGYPSLLTYSAWEKARKKQKRHAEITELLNNNAGGMHHEELTRLSKEHHGLTTVATLVEEIEGLRKELRELTLLSRSTDAEMAALAKEEMPVIIERAMAAEEAIVQYLLPDAEVGMRDAILEVRAGTGGEEAALWAKDMFHMYEAFAARRGWTFNTLEISHGDAGGYKEASASISGENVFGLLKFEAGVHRVQRIPITDAAGRIQTSAATVAIMPEAQEVDVEINESKDLKIDVFRAQGAGGQHVNKTESAVRITHLPTGISVQMQDERSQVANRVKAMKILRSRLYEAARLREQAERAALRSEQIGTGDRSERIRTYNYRESRITDHRINVTKHGMEEMLSGILLDEFIDELTTNDRKLQLQNI